VHGGCKTQHRVESDGLDLEAGYTIIDLGIGALKNDFFKNKSCTAHHSKRLNVCGKRPWQIDCLGVKRILQEDLDYR